ncbi:hypothetical protein RHMOL_Rhmol05G0174500 [Rhododendron molle]|uniref:Uncharacterized protein n=1 Tax=Rhododendron molle TaxID=49168 RepID=A0ACC0NSI4_RHOML|nr:hypothetical protein RHMOL_Rhmol05G0174500 [Rhododendron molle]
MPADNTGLKLLPEGVNAAANLFALIVESELKTASASAFIDESESEYLQASITGMDAREEAQKIPQKLWKSHILAGEGEGEMPLGFDKKVVLILSILGPVKLHTKRNKGVGRQRTRREGKALDPSRFRDLLSLQLLKHEDILLKSPIPFLVEEGRRKFALVFNRFYDLCGMIADKPSLYVLDTSGVLVPIVQDIEIGLKLALAGFITQSQILMLYVLALVLLIWE